MHFFSEWTLVWSLNWSNLCSNANFVRFRMMNRKYFLDWNQIFEAQWHGRSQNLPQFEMIRNESVNSFIFRRISIQFMALCNIIQMNTSIWFGYSCYDFLFRERINTQLSQITTSWCCTASNWLLKNAPFKLILTNEWINNLSVT